MKNIIIIILVSLFINTTAAQELGNAYYLNRVDFSNSSAERFVPPIPVADGNIHISIKGLANVTADSYVAIFNVRQMGKDVEEVNRLIDERINGALDLIREHEDVETFIDMISFVPKYEIVVTKKRFSKKSYNEMPAGFELKKNLHIRYKDPNFLNEIIAVMSGYEIYDMVRVDYFSDQIEAMKKELRQKAKQLILDKTADYEEILGVSLEDNERRLVDGYKVMLPVELYQSYQVYSRSSLDQGKVGVSQTNISKTHYYQPIVEKEFDYVINSSILNPVIQITYVINVTILKKVKEVKKVEKEIIVEKQFILVTPEGLVKQLDTCRD